MLGKASANFGECHKESLIGIDFDIKIDLSSETTGQNDWKVFNKKYIPIHQSITKNVSNVSSGFACVKVWEIRFGMNIGDIVFTPDGSGNYYIAEIISDYLYNENFCIPHCRKVRWLGQINKSKISVNFKNSMGATHTIINIEKYKDEIEEVIRNIEPFETSSNKKKDTSDSRVFLYEITDKSLNWKKLKVYNDFKDMQLIYELEDCEEYTYIMFDRAHDTIKIGKTKNDPEQRFNQLRTANPSIILLHTFPSSLFPERDLHIKFSDYLKDLEWFFNTKGLQKFIADEQGKHKKIIESYKKRIELDNLEKDLFNTLKFEINEKTIQ